MKECPICKQHKKKYEFSLKDKNVCRLCYKKLEPVPEPEPKPTKVDDKKYCSFCKKKKHKSNFELKTKCRQCQSVNKVKDKVVVQEKKEITLSELKTQEEEKLKQGYTWVTRYINKGTSFETKVRKLVKL